MRITPTMPTEARSQERRALPRQSVLFRTVLVGSEIEGEPAEITNIARSGFLARTAVSREKVKAARKAEESLRKLVLSTEYTEPKARALSDDAARATADLTLARTMRRDMFWSGETELRLSRLPNAQYFSGSAEPEILFSNPKSVICFTHER